MHTTTYNDNHCYYHQYYYRCLMNKHSSRCGLCLESSDPAPRISKLTQRYPAAADKNECLFIRPIALTFAISVNIDSRGEGVRPTLTSSRMSACLSDTGIMNNNNGDLDGPPQAFPPGPAPAWPAGCCCPSKSLHVTIIIIMMMIIIIMRMKS